MTDAGRDRGVCHLLILGDTKEKGTYDQIEESIRERGSMGILEGLPEGTWR